MLDERDLDAAVAAGVLDAPTRDALVRFARDHRRGEVGPDEEQFRLLTGFNDIFVTIAVVLLLIAIGSIGGALAPALGPAAVAAASWGLAEYFTRIKRFALPSIVLLLAFVGGVFLAALAATGGITASSAMAGSAPGAASLAGLLAAGAAWLHWRRFHVPITVAAGALALSVIVIAGTAAVTGTGAPVLVAMALCGVAVFALAMWFDSSDRARVTRRTDVAFWLHLLAAPLIIHPVFKLTGLSGEGVPSGSAAALIILIYLLLTALALAIDRRALLVSALAYVIYAVQALVGTGGGQGFAMTALVLGLFLVLLSAAWKPIRRALLALFPPAITLRLPAAT